jgi:hypothetical protein
MLYTSGKSGRRKLAFEESSERNKRRKSKDHRETVGFPELTHAIKMILISACKTDAAKRSSGALETDPKSALRIRKTWAAHTKNIFVPCTTEEALSLFTEAHRTKRQYINIRNQANIKKCNMYPIYRVIKAAKGGCFPSKNKILTQEYLVELGLQAVMDKTASRIFMAKKCHRHCSGRYFERISKMGLRWKHRTQQIEAMVIGR